MKRNLMKKNKWTDVVRSAVGIVIFACLFAIAFTSCEEDETTKPPEGDLSKVYVDDARFQYPIEWGDPYFDHGNTMIGNMDSNKLSIEAHCFTMFVHAPIDDISVSDTLIGDTIEISLSPKYDYESEEDPCMTRLNFYCTIYNIPKNKTFWVKLIGKCGESGTRDLSLSKKFSTW